MLGLAQNFAEQCSFLSQINQKCLFFELAPVVVVPSFYLFVGVSSLDERDEESDERPLCAAAPFAVVVLVPILRLFIPVMPMVTFPVSFFTIFIFDDSSKLYDRLYAVFVFDEPPFA